MHNSDNEQLKGRGTPVNIDYHCFRNYKLFNVFEEDNKSSSNKDESINEKSKLK